MNLRTTKHFNDRCKERLGISKKSANKYFAKAYSDGIRSCEFSNKLFKDYLAKILDNSKEETMECICYHHHIIVYKPKEDGNGYVAITVLNIPREYLYLVDGYYKRRNGYGKTRCNHHPK